MNRKEVSNLLEKIQAYRQSFLITNTLIREWERILEPYDYEDVNRRLDEYFKNGDNFGKYPDVYYLIKYLKKSEDKLKTGVNYARCHLCQKLVDYMEFNNHYERCSSVEYLCNMSERYFSKKLNKEKLLVANKEEFKKYYWEFCKKLYEKIDDNKLAKHSLKNAILTHDGLKPEYSLKELF